MDKPPTLSKPNEFNRTRILCFGGFILTTSLILLGASWPSIFTPVAIFALPSPILFLVSVIWPSLFRNYQSLKWYLIISVITAALCWIFEIVWLIHAGQ
jgi:hypothetical protein